MSDTALAAEVHEVVEPGQSALIDGLGVEADATTELTKILGDVQTSLRALSARLDTLENALIAAGLHTRT